MRKEANQAERVTASVTETNGRGIAPVTAEAFIRSLPAGSRSISKPGLSASVLLLGRWL